jgi:photosynthetic reaction center cytochrome c subunit
MMRFRHVVVAGVAFAMVALAGSLAIAQEGRRGGAPAPPPEPTNLKVLPAGTTTAQLLPAMRAFAAALGTNCGYCHVWTGPGLPTNNYASDEKPAKEVARTMMRMAGTINQTLAANIKKPAGEITQVQCMTCHRGEAIPKLPPPAPAGERGAAPPAGGGRQ